MNIEWGTLPYGVKVEGRGEVCGGGGVGWVTLPHPILPYGVHVGYKTDQEMKCVCVWGGGRSEHWVGYPTLGDRSEHWVVTLPYGTSIIPRDFLGDPCPPASVKWGTSDNLRGQNISAAAKIAFDFKSCMNTPFF